LVYNDVDHITGTYSTYIAKPLQGILTNELGL